LLLLYKLSKRSCLSYWTTVVFKLSNRLTCSPILEWTSYCIEDWQQPICKRIQRKWPFLCQAETERNRWVYFSCISSLNHQTSPSLYEAVLRSSVCFLNLKKYWCLSFHLVPEIRMHVPFPPRPISSSSHAASSNLLLPDIATFYVINANVQSCV
jgi:hypothetical protein